MLVHDDPAAGDVFALDVSEWLNGDPITMDALRGRVVVIEAFQMLCPGCVSHGLPLAQRIRQHFDPDEVVVLGLHTVFEHHAVMGREALAVFLAEYRIGFPVAIDRPIAGQAVPATMERYALRGTPSTLVIGRDGRLRRSVFGAVDDLTIGALLGQLLAEPWASEPGPTLTAGMSSPDTADPDARAVAAPTANACRLDGTCS